LQIIQKETLLGVVLFGYNIAHWEFLTHVRRGIGGDLTEPSQPAAKGGSRKILVVVALCCLAALMGVGWMVWGFLAPTPPIAVAPRDIVEQNGPPTAAGETSESAPGELTIHLDQPGAAISPTLFGLALEEINHSLDGGLYAELLPNRDLSGGYRQIVGGVVKNVEGQNRVVGGTIIFNVAWWFLSQSGDVKAEMQTDTAEQAPGTAAKSSLRLTVSSIGKGGRAGIYNDGYWGVPVEPNWTYHASFYAKAGKDFSGSFVASIETQDNQTVFATATIDKIDQSWRRYDLDLKTPENIAPSTQNRFEISTTGTGTVWLSEISLFPPTFNHRPNGNRIDLMEKLATLKPGFIIFPGGDTLDGRITRFRFNWKNTIGPPEGRPAQPSAWERMSNGFGLMDFLLTCEDLHAEPVLGIYDGTSTAQHVEPGKDLAPYVQDALDEIEYVAGDKSTTWGARRAADGHPDPFPLHYLQIGNNEQLYNQNSYDARFTQFHDAIKTKYPDLKLIGWMDLTTARKPDVSHESFYSSAREILDRSNHYDNLSRSGPRYAMEVNAMEGDPGKTLYAALADMSWMLGAERNADLVVMATAAPTFVQTNAGAQQHPANLIAYNSLSSYGSPTYYALRMFNLNKGDTVIPIEFTPPEIDAPGDSSFHGAIGVGSWGSRVEFRDIKVTAPDGTVLYQTDSSSSLTQWRIGEGSWKMDKGTLRQTSRVIDCTAMAGDPNWTDYMLTLKARVIDGIEGFLILVRTADDGNFVWWNVGGWNDYYTGLQQTMDGDKFLLGSQIRNSVQALRWYDIRVQVKGPEIICYLDNAPILVGRQRSHVPASGRMSAAASRDTQIGDVILKVVNPMPMPAVVNINLAGGSAIAETGTLEAMQGSPGDVNTFNSPEKIVPTTTKVHFPGEHFSHEFPAYSISVLRIKGK
jgi:alpha-L-arabinofuranosidase